MIAQTNPLKCYAINNQEVIDYLEIIKRLNVNDEFEINGQKIKDPFNLCKEIDSRITIHSKHAFIKNYPKILKQGVISTII